MTDEKIQAQMSDLVDLVLPKLKKVKDFVIGDKQCTLIIAAIIGFIPWYIIAKAIIGPMCWPLALVFTLFQLSGVTLNVWNSLFRKD